MNFSFYRNLTWLIGILVAVEIFLKMGVNRGLTFMIADLIIVLVLTFLFHGLRKAGVDPDPSSNLDFSLEANVINSKTESEWRKKHDQWWKTHRQMVMAKQSLGSKDQPEATITKSAEPVKSTSSSSVNVSQLERSNQELKSQINQLNQKMTLAKDSQNHLRNDSRQSKWYQQVKRIKRQIAQLKSEYK